MLLEEPVPALEQGELQFWPHWLSPEEADGWLEQLIAQVQWSQPQLFIHGRWLPVPRLTAWYGEPQARYRYSGVNHEPLPWTPLLAAIRARLEQHCGSRFNAVLLNYYRDGQDSMGWHSDDEAELGVEPVIASLSLGGARRFDLRRQGTTRIAHSLTLGHGSLLVMGGQTQHYWQHQIAKTRKPCAPRLNLTFRWIGPRHG